MLQKKKNSAWGPSFCHLLLMTHGNEIFPRIVSSSGGEGNRKKHHSNISKRRKRGRRRIPTEIVETNNLNSPIPKIFGFRIHKDAIVQYPFKK